MVVCGGWKASSAAVNGGSFSAVGRRCLVVVDVVRGVWLSSLLVGKPEKRPRCCRLPVGSHILRDPAAAWGAAAAEDDSSSSSENITKNPTTERRRSWGIVPFGSVRSDGVLASERATS